MATKKAAPGMPEVVRLPLMGAYSNRGFDGTTDQRFLNMFPETRKVDQLENTKIFINKRPGLSLFRDYGTGEGRGVIYFNGKFYAAVGNKLYEDAVSPVEKITFTGSTGHVGLLLGNSSTLGDYLFVCDGTEAWTIDTSGTVTSVSSTSVYGVTITSGGSGYVSAPTVSFSGGGGTGAAATATISGGVVVGVTMTNVGTGYTSPPTVSFSSGAATATASLNALPSPHIPMPTIIDGYVVLSKGSDVYTCDVDNPHKWSAENFLSAEMFPDAVVGLSRQNNQVVVFGSSSTEFFYDAANASGSPLSRNDSTTMQMGNASPYSTYANEQYFIFVGQSTSGGRAVWQVKGFQPTKISDEYIERILDAETDMSDVRGFGLRTKGHLFYVINLKTLNRTLVYDLDEKLWHEWSSNSGDTHNVFGCDYMADKEDGFAYLLHASNGSLYKLDPSVYQDDGTAILCELITNRYDMDTYHRKFLYSVKLVGDRYEGSNDVTLYWSDNDYQTWSNAKTISMTDDFPAFHRLGSFRRRAFKLTHSGNDPLRVESLECEYKEGST